MWISIGIVTGAFLLVIVYKTLNYIHRTLYHQDNGSKQDSNDGSDTCKTSSTLSVVEVPKHTVDQATSNLRSEATDTHSTACLPLATKPVPSSVNYHFTRRCNYKCGFCFHTAKTSFVLPLDEAKSGLQMLKDAGMEKMNFSGGEPFLEDKGKLVGELVKYCKSTLQLASVSIVSNGSLIKESWFRTYGEYLDILAVSCDSFNPETNVLIGRQQGRKCHLESLNKVRDWCTEYKVAFKINTVVNIHNKEEDMTEHINQLNPCRWKVFQCLLLDGENAGGDSLRDATKFVISDDEFSQYLERHAEVTCLVPESNKQMQNSYLILDEYMRFLDCRENKKTPSKSILDIGVDEALLFSGFDEKMFLKRGGKYQWSKADMKLEW